MLERDNRPEDKEYDFWDELPDHVKAGIDEGIAQADAGDVFSHEEVMKEYEKWLKR